MTKSTKKLTFVNFALMIALLLILAACGGSDDDGPRDDQTVISFWHSSTNIVADAIDAVVEEFEDQNPDIYVDTTYIAGGGEGQNERLLSAIAGNNPPDVTYFDRFEVASWAAQGALEDLSEYAERDGVTGDDYYPYTWEEANYEGGLYALPTTTDARMLFYNIDHFEEVGLDPDNPPQTIDELDAAVELLTDQEGSRFNRIGFIPWAGQGWFYGWGWSFGGDFYEKETGTVTAHHPKNVEALEWMVDFGKRYGVEEIAGFEDSQGSGAMDPFISGQLSMRINGSSSVSSIANYNPDLNYGVTPIPTPTGDNHTTWSGGWSVVMPIGAEEPDAAWEFIKFFGGKDGQKIFSEISGDFAAIPLANEELGYPEDPIFGEFMKILPDSNTRPVMSEGSLYWNELASVVEYATRDQGTPQELLEEVSRRVQEALDSNEPGEIEEILEED